MLVASQTATWFARERGLAVRRLASVDLLVRELAWNLVWHAGGGEIALRWRDEPGPSGLHIASTDQGPGIASLARKRDSRGLGLGLSTIGHQCDEFVLHTRVGHGTRIEAVLWQSRSL